MRSLTLLILCLAFQDSEVDRWIADLVHDEIVMRDQAERGLIKSGEKVLASLKASLKTAPEAHAARVRAVIEEIERPGREKEHDARRRPMALRLVTIQVKDATLTSVLASLEKQLGLKFESHLKEERRVTLDFKDAPYRRCIDAIEDQLEASIREWEGGTALEVRDGRFLRSPRGYGPGVTLQFSARPYSKEGKFTGTRLKVRDLEGTSPWIQGWDVRDTAGKPIVVETCKSCGPMLALVKCAEGQELRVKIKGSVCWESLYEFKVADPAVSQSFRVGTYTATYEFPRVSVTSAVEVPRGQFARAGLRGTYKEGHGPNRDRRFGGRFGGRIGERDPGVWCDCGPAGPVVVVVEVGPTLKSKEYEEYEYRDYEPSDFQSMDVVIYKRFEEPFEVEAVIPAD
ncbi:MAG TPA: hypothetical protein VJU16_07640 [Planctomycetota bacterium]|nr:hypothetical protein [Planctomycetota bacterium]